MCVCVFKNLWFNGYPRRKWTRRNDFKSGNRLLVFPCSTNTLPNDMNQEILFTYFWDL